MKLPPPWSLTIAAAVTIMAVLGWEQHTESEATKRLAKESGGVQKWDYDGGWPRDLAMILSGVIVVLQIYSSIKTTKKPRR